jgi:hypothetical protein
MDLREMGAYLSTPAPRDLLRVEARDWYDSAADDPHFTRWTEGEPTQVDEGWQAWLDKIAADTAAGMTWRRVHVIAAGQPLNGYLSFEFGEQYTRNANAGEQIRILEVPTHQIVGREYTDLYVADGERIALMTYDEGGKFVRAEAAGHAGYWTLHAEHLWAEAAPFSVWWSMYQQRKAA